ncbi:MAG: UDP-N-acetylmuramate dehydrogenase [Leucobacter sp.]
MTVDLSAISRWKIGGAASELLEPETFEELVRFMRSPSTVRLVIGQTSNLLFDSDGFRGVLIRIAERLGGWAFDGTRAIVSGGASVINFVRAAAEEGLGGIEHAAGIPGTIGGLIVMNGGSKRRGIGEHILSVTIVDDHGATKKLKNDDLSFGYRTSALQSLTTAIVEVELNLEQVGPNRALAAVESVLAERAGKFPLDLPNCGSTFLSDPSLYTTLGAPGKAIEQAGLKGLTRGGAQVSEKHANFIVNRGGVKSDEVLWLIGTVRKTVWEQTGIAMRAEVRRVTPDGLVRPAHEAAEERYPELRIRE